MNLTTLPQHYKLYYDALMAVLAVVIIGSLFVEARFDLSDNETLIFREIDYAVWIIFVVDYIVRFILSKDKLQFLRHNIIDLISILPFEAAFQGLRALRVLRLIYMLRVFVYLNRIHTRLSALVTTNDFHHVLWFTFSTIFCGAIAISYVDDMEIGDALWWSFVTTTTVGYGDIAPQSFGGRIIAVFLMLIGIGFLSMLTGTIATFFINRDNSRSSYCDDTVKEIAKKLEHFSDLTINDIEDMHSVLVALKERQKQQTH